MKEFAISFYKNFKCIGPKCPHTCCQGWKILVDDETYNNIRSDQGEIGKEARLKVATNNRFSLSNEIEHTMRKGIHGKCLCLTKDGLCSLQKRDRMDLMPVICINYPRRILEFGDFRETTMELACPEAARLFIEAADLQMEEGLDSISNYRTNWTVGNDDKFFLDLLKKWRQKVVSQVMKSEVIDKYVLSQIYTLFFDIHFDLLKNDMTAVEEKIDNFDMTAVEEKIEGFEMDEIEKPSDYLFYNMEIMDKIVAYNLMPDNLDFNHKSLRKVIKGYFRYFNDLTNDQANTFYNEKYTQMKQEIPGLEKKYKKYYCYYMYEMLLASYEDYYVLKVVLLGNMYLQIYRILDLVAWLMSKEEKIEYDSAKQATLLSDLDRKMRHNISITDGILQRLRQEFINVT
ncbi:MAG: flagellin lysine-N-methylase [Lachnospiraceae bacterium]|nr:flagellin lysine-N-methylase [Lachnospiraceae bacterium]